MKIIILVFSLLAEMHLIHQLSIKREGIWSSYISFMQALIKPYLPIKYSNYILLGALILPFTFVVYVFQLLFSQTLFGVLDMIFQWVVVVICLGPRNAFYPQLRDENENQSAIDHLVAMNRDLFSVMILYLLAGPFAILLYRLIVASTQQDGLSNIAERLMSIISYLPARITALLYLLVGHFQIGLQVFYQKKFYAPDETISFLKEVVKLSFCNDSNQLTFKLADIVLKHAITLFLVIVSVLTVAFWF
jgi:AmpE protein